MNEFRVVVVDDEPLARDMMVTLLERDGEVVVVGRCRDAEDARKVIRQEQPHIVFLDIEMPGTDGLELARDPATAPPAFVFVTAYSEYATQAFDVQALDYVLKPFSDERFFQALERSKRRVRERTLSDTLKLAAASSELPPSFEGAETPYGGYLTRLSIRNGDRSVVLKVSEVTWIKADDYYVLIHSGRGQHLLRASMASLEARLDPTQFLRIHRAALVNVDEVREVERVSKGHARVVLSDGTRLPISRARRPQVEEVLLPRLRTPSNFLG